MTAYVDQTSADRICGDMYREAQEFLRTIDFEPPFGFKILNGPPILNARILFIGYQPAGDEDDAKEEQQIPTHNGRGTHNGWPLKCEYATADWKLARKMRRIFGKERLEECVGTNVIFLRYPNEDCYRKHVNEKRGQIEKFCKAKIEAIIDAVDPKRIITIGFKALEMFGPTEKELLRQDGKNALTKTGRIANRPAVGTIHLAAGRGLFNSELDRLADRFEAY